VFSTATLPTSAGSADTTVAPAKTARRAAAPATKTQKAAEVATDADAPAADDLPAGALAATEDGAAPAGHEIKGNRDSGLYHVPGSRFYNQTVAEFWFASAEAAEAAGFQLPPSQRDNDQEDPS
jgi:large subunit ribosomal protein L17